MCVLIDAYTLKDQVRHYVSSLPDEDKTNDFDHKSFTEQNMIGIGRLNNITVQ